MVALAFSLTSLKKGRGHVAQGVERLTEESEVQGLIPCLAKYFCEN